MVAPIIAKRTYHKMVDLKCVRSESDVRKQFRDMVLHEQQRRHLASATLIEDDSLLDELIEKGFTAETIPAIHLAPVAAAAWGSGEVTSDEALAAVEAIFSSDNLESIKAAKLFRSWLSERPSADLLILWERYTHEKLKALSPSQREAQVRELLEHATRVALASGGFLGIGQICAGERQVLETISRVYGLPG